MRRDAAKRHIEDGASNPMSRPGTAPIITVCRSRGAPEDYAAITARAIKLATQYVWPLTTSAGRDAHCAGSYAALAPIPYPFGIPSC